jgi:hypothetical protein
MDGAQTNTRERVEVAEGVEPASPQNDTPSHSLSLAERLAEIRAGAFGIGKDNIEMSYTDKKTGERKKFMIKGHTVEAVLSEMRPLLNDNRVLLIPNLVERAYNGNRCDVLVDFEWESLDDPKDRRIVRWAGAGTDDGDKGFSKAGTNALKEHLKKLFLITDRDDAKEEEDKVEHKTGDGASRADLDHARDERRAAIEQWAKTFKEALSNAVSVKDIQRLHRENAEQLGSKDLPEVTRSFFNELIETRKAAIIKADSEE